VLEHLVDVVLMFEGAEGGLRTLRATKNRFGSTQELGLFEMGEQGLRAVENPSSLFLAGGGGPVLPLLSGTRTLLAEVQALVTPVHFGSPQRSSSGLDPYRLSLLYAVLEKRCGMALYSHDVFVSMAGGLKVTEPAADLAVAAAVAASLRNRPLPQGLAAFGEVGLGGELRPVSRPEDRLREAARLGCAVALCPRPAADKDLPALRKAAGGMELKLSATLADALEMI
jgi:DNA repair protein RadA/Sms